MRIQRMGFINVISLRQCHFQTMKFQTAIAVILSFLVFNVNTENPSIERQKSGSLIAGHYPRYSNSWNPAVFSSSRYGSNNYGGRMVGGTQQRLTQPLMQGMIGTQYAAPRTSLFSGLLGSLGSGMLGSRGMLGTNILGSGVGTYGTNIGTYGTGIGTYGIGTGTYGTNIGTVGTNIGTVGTNIGTSGTNIGTGIYGISGIPISTGGIAIGQNLRTLLTTFLRPPSTAVLVNQYPAGVVTLTTIKPIIILTTLAPITTTGTTTVGLIIIPVTTVATTVLAEELDWETFLPGI